MSCECSHQSANTEEQRRTLRVALTLNTTMFVVGLIAGLYAQSTGLLADALDMLADALAYAIALLAIGQSDNFKQKAAKLSGSLLLILGISIVAEIIFQALRGSEPVGTVMIVVAGISLAVNVTVLRMLGRYRGGESHLNASWIFTRADVVVNISVIASGVIVSLSSAWYADLVIGFAIGLYVIKEALEILRNKAMEASKV
jgi:cation diffusion facilitator family transporter